MALYIKLQTFHYFNEKPDGRIDFGIKLDCTE